MPQINCINDQETVSMLKNKSIMIDNWGRLEYNKLDQEEFIFKYQTPKNAIDLHYLSFQAIDWLQESSWFLYRLDNSTSFSLDEKIIFYNQIGLIDKLSSKEITDNILMKHESSSTLLSTAGGGIDINIIKIRSIASMLVNLTLQFSAHAWLIGSSENSSSRLGVQDGFLYFCTTDQIKVKKAESMTSHLENSGFTLPDWIISE